MKNNQAEKNTPPNKEVEIRLKEQYKKYALWYSLPSILKGKTKEALDLQSVAGFDDDSVLELLALKTKGEVAKYLGVSSDAITDWSKKLQGSTMFEEMKLWVNGLMKNVVLSTYRSAMSSNPKAHQDRKLMLQLGGWVEKLSVDVTAQGLAGIVKSELDHFRTEHEQPPNKN